MGRAVTLKSCASALARVRLAPRGKLFFHASNGSVGVAAAAAAFFFLLASAALLVFASAAEPVPSFTALLSIKVSFTASGVAVVAALSAVAAAAALNGLRSKRACGRVRHCPSHCAAPMAPSEALSRSRREKGAPTLVDK